MPRTIIQFRIFIASPGGLEDERRHFREKLEFFSKTHAEPEGFSFHPVGWEDTLPGVGRPQELINRDLEQCDYVLFALHDRWGSPTGTHTSGFHEEWELAEKLYKETKIANIVIFFKDVGPGQVRDPGAQLKEVIKFKAHLESERRYLFRGYSTLEGFCGALEEVLAQWLRDRRGILGASSSASHSPENPLTSLPSAKSVPAKSAPEPGYDYWIAETQKLLNKLDYSNALYCAAKAEGSAKSPLEWATAANTVEYTHILLSDFQTAINKASEIVGRVAEPVDPLLGYQVARALANKGFSLGALGRRAEAISAYDSIVTRFGAAGELKLREHVAEALFRKIELLASIGNVEEARETFQDLFVRFGSASEPTLKEVVADGRSRLKRLARMERLIKRDG